MSTFISISVQKKYKNCIEQGFDIIKDVENSLSSYKPTATVYLLNKKKDINLDTYTYEALKLCDKYYHKTDGYFDITVASITKDLYRFGGNERLVSLLELQKANINFYGLKFDEKKAHLDKNIKIDLGGMGKGFAIDKVAKYFRFKGINKAMISASGDIRCLDKCKISIQDPFSENILMSFKTTQKDLAISTSGTYNRYIKNQKNNHLINPKLKKPQTKFVSISLIGDMPNSDLDAYATAASVMPIQTAYKFLEAIDVAYIVVLSDGLIKKAGNLSLIESDTIKK
ncbi:MAG: thiamine biosynthesis protein ApbE [Sulfurimonas sp.]|nr:MAG: thiamine biosynthesis protein ApbE [Sulfurimonas sp.]